MDALVSTPIPMRYLDAVESGMEFLDSEYPTWLQSIDLAHLDLEDVGCCVLGQVFGFYSKGIEELGIDDPYALGFSIHDEDEVELARRNGSLENVSWIMADRWAQLTEAWKAKLRVRLGQ